MPVLKFNECDYNCYRKSTNRGYRVYCRKVHPECGREIRWVEPVETTIATKVRPETEKEAERIINFIEPFPPPLTATQTIGTKHFHEYKTGYHKEVDIGDIYIGTPEFAVLKSFRPDLTEQLLKLAKKWPARFTDAQFRERYDSLATLPSTEVQWKLVGIIPQKHATKTPLGYDYGDAAIFVSCHGASLVTHANARYIHIAVDRCPNATFFSKGLHYPMVVICNGERVLATMPLKTELSGEVHLAMANLLCRRRVHE